MMFVLTFAIGLTAATYGIVVERNYNIYFRVPISLNGGDKKYHIIQCPQNRNSVVLMPKPQDMPICITVGIYSERGKLQQNRLMMTPLNIMKPGARSKLRTKVDYTHLKEIHRTSTVRKQPQRHQRNESQSKSHSYDRKRKSGETDQVLASSSSLQQRENPNDADIQINNKTYVGNVNKNDDDEDINIHNNNKNDEYAYDEDYNEDYSSIRDDYGELNDDHSNNDENEMKSTALKYIGVRDLIRKFAENNEKKLYDTRNDHDNNDDFSLESQSFFSNHETFAHGDIWKGYQNSYHRDELYNDHIFYDDQDDHGTFHSHSKEHKNY